MQDHGRAGPRPQTLNMRSGGGWPLVRACLLALLALAVLSGGGLAAGDLFDDDYADCPHRTRLRDGQIADLSATRVADDEHAVTVSWAGTDPATWGLGPNAFDTALVVLLDDDSGTLHSRSLALDTRQVTFDNVATGTEVTVQLAIVVDTAAGDYLISDILEAGVHQSLSPPRFWRQVRRGPANGPWEAGQATEGRYYFIGYGEAFLNFKQAPGGPPIGTMPATPRLRVGLVHGGEDDDARDAVDFASYVLRITDSDGDVVPEADDMALRDAAAVPLQGNVALFDPANATHYTHTVIFVGAVGVSSQATLASIDGKFSNVRVNEGGAIRENLWNGGPKPTGTQNDGTAVGFTARRTVPQNVADIDQCCGLNVNNLFPSSYTIANTIHVKYADAFRDFPMDVMASDETYTLTAWAVNEDDEAISPVETLRVHPLDWTITFTEALTDSYHRTETHGAVNTLALTQFTVFE